jgi:hypothetical protein
MSFPFNDSKAFTESLPFQLFFQVLFLFRHAMTAELLNLPRFHLLFSIPVPTFSM